MSGTAFFCFFFPLYEMRYYGKKLVITLHNFWITINTSGIKNQKKKTSHPPPNHQLAAIFIHKKDIINA